MVPTMPVLGAPDPTTFENGFGKQKWVVLLCASFAFVAACEDCAAAPVGPTLLRFFFGRCDPPSFFARTTALSSYLVHRGPGLFPFEVDSVQYFHVPSLPPTAGIYSATSCLFVDQVFDNDRESAELGFVSPGCSRRWPGYSHSQSRLVDNFLLSKVCLRQYSQSQKHCPRCLRDVTVRRK